LKYLKRILLTLLKGLRVKSKIKRIVLKIARFVPAPIKHMILKSRYGWKIKSSLISEYRVLGIDQNDLSTRIYILEQLVNGLLVELTEHIQNSKEV